MHTWIGISRSVLRHNVATIESLVAPTEVGYVIKNNAYGHGIDVISDLLLYDWHDRYLFTVSTSEAISVKQRHPYARVCAMSYIDTSYESCVRYGVACPVYTVSMIQDLQRVAAACHMVVSVHLKVDTGMHRLGVSVSQAPLLIRLIHSCLHLYLEGVYTHLADLASSQQHIAYMQRRRFAWLYRQHARDASYWHAGSSGLVTQSHEETLIRVGSNMYGIFKSSMQQRSMQHGRLASHIHPILTWYARVVSLKWVEPHEPIGYGGSYVAQRKMCIAILPVGYGDGYPCTRMHTAFVYIRGQYAPLVGAVSMNAITIDVTDIDSVVTGDVAEIMGQRTAIHPDTIAGRSGYMTLEVLSRIPPYIPRYVNEVLGNIQPYIPRYIET